MRSLWCANCAKQVRTDNAEGKTCCSLCGRVLAEDNFTEDTQFIKTSDGQARMAGNFVRTVQESAQNRQRTLDEAYYGIKAIQSDLDIDGGDDITNTAVRLYEKALQKNFTRGRRKEQVQAACLYIVCRMHKKPYLLIDFSEHLRINVYVLGAVFLQLCKVLSLEGVNVLQNLVDPSLFIHRFADRLFKKSADKNVSKTALQIVASMKRDWMQSGRKPSGLCGAALYISALAHGLTCSKTDIIKVVHICEATLTKRLIEFENTESGGLTIEEFEKKSLEFADLAKKFDIESLMNSRKGDLLCQHKDDPEFAYGLCEKCYKEFMELSGGLIGGSEPPAFQRAERKRIMAEEAAADRSENLDSSLLPGPTKTNIKLLNYDGQKSIKNTSQDNVTQSPHPDSTGATLKSSSIHDTINDSMDACNFTLEESESLSDIDDKEVDVYINTEEEKNLKTTVWEEINREYLDGQAKKEADALAAKKSYEAHFANCSDDVKGARQLSEAAIQNRKEKRQKRAAELKNLGPPQTAGYALKQMLGTKTWSSKIRYDLLDELIDSDERSPKRSPGKAEETKMEDPELDAYTEEYDYNDLNHF